MRAGAALVCFLVAASMPFIAKAADPCANAISTIQINKCLETRHAARDKALNAAYQDLLKRLVPTDRLDKTDFPRARKHLVDAQRAWITFRDEDCKGRLVIYEAGSSTMQGQTVVPSTSPMTARRMRPRSLSPAK